MSPGMTVNRNSRRIAFVGLSSAVAGAVLGWVSSLSVVSKYGLAVVNTHAGCSVAIAEQQFVLGRLKGVAEGTLLVPCGQSKEVFEGGPSIAIAVLALKMRHPYSSGPFRRPVLHIDYGSSRWAENNHLMIYTFNGKPSWWRWL